MPVSPAPATSARASVSTRARAPAAQHRPLLGIALLVSAMWVLSGLDATGKYLLSIEVPLIVLTWTRYALHLAMCLALFLPARGPRVLHSRFPRAQFARGCAVACATMLFFSTLRYLPLAEASAINFLAPLLTLTVAPYLLKEKPSAARWTAAIVAFVGVLIVIRPGNGLHPLGTLLGLATACAMCVQHVCNRKIAGDDPFTSLIWTGALGTLLLTPILLWQLDDAGAAVRNMTVVQWVLLISTGVTGSVGHLLQIMAYRNAAASSLAPFIYLQILSAAGLGWLIWGQFPDQVTWVGISIICVSGISIAAYEWHGVRKVRRAGACGADRTH